MAKILVVEDEPGIAFGLGTDLRTDGYEVVIVGNGLDAVRVARTDTFNLILLDVMLPSQDGFEVCRQLRCGGMKTPIIMLTAKSNEAEKILGLDSGADDYVTKPFSHRELRARIRALLRRAEEETTGPGRDFYRFGDFELDMARFELRREGRSLEATTTELRLLAALARNRGIVLSRDRLLEEVWGPGIAINDRVVDNHIVALRKKIEDHPITPRYLISVRGVGYRFDG